MSANERPTSDLRATARAVGQEDQSAAEDPLVELARIVNRNKQAGASVTSNRVGNTDYFAGLDDLGGETDTLSRGAPEPVVAQRVEPQFGGAVQEQHVQAEEAPVAAEDDWGLEESLSAAVAASHQPAAASAPAYEVQPASRLGNTVSLDLEQNLTAELEDELMGALRQSFDPVAPASPEVDYQEQDYAVEDVQAEPAVYADEAADAPAAYEPAYDVTAYDGAEAQSEPQGAQATDTGYADSWPEEAETADPYATAYELSAPAEAEFEEPYEAEPVHQAPAVSVSSYASSSRDHEQGGWQYDQEPEPAQAYEDDPADEPYQAPARKASVVDEDDLFAALSIETPAAATSYRAPEVSASHVSAPQAAARSSAGPDFDALFADLDFGTSAKAKPAPGRAPVDVSDDIDDMSWPTAAAMLPETPEDDAPPPPGGYDLDAVARAMQESDPTIGQQGVLPPHPEREMKAAPHGGGSRKGLYAAGAVLAVALVGGAVVLLTGDNSVSVPDGAPPVIAGLEEPLKVYPEEQPKEENQSSKLIYDRVGSNASDPSRERLVLPEQTQPAELPPAPAGVVTSDPLVPSGPKKVRTLVVRPDGTIIEGDEPSGAPAPIRSVATAPAQPGAGTETPAGTDTSLPGTTLPGAAPAVPAIVSGAETGETPAEGTPQTAADLTPVEQPPASEIPSALPKGKPAAPVRTAAATPQQTAPVRSGPLDLTNPAAAPVRTAPVQTQAQAPAVAQPAAAAPSSGSIPDGTYVVQVTSQRSDAAARDAYTALQRKYPSVLGGRSAVIVAAEIPDKGTFYRARIPAGSKDEAIQVCESLQAAGGDCFVRRQ